MTDPIAAQVEQLDRERLRLFCAGNPDAFVAPFVAQNNISRWCSLGNMSTLLRLAKPASVELIDYRQMRDTNAGAMVTCAAVAITA